MNNTISSAIRSRAVLQISYEGTSRTVEPHCHGISRPGNEVLRAYQTGGYSMSGQSVGWKLFEVSKMTSIRATGAVFPRNRPGFNPTDSAMAMVYSHV